MLGLVAARLVYVGISADPKSNNTNADLEFARVTQNGILHVHVTHFATGFGIRNVYTIPNTMVSPFGAAKALYSFSYLKNTFQSCLRSI